MGKIIKIILLILLIAILVILLGAWSMFGEKVTAAGSVKKLDDGLYYLEYKGDYGFQEYLDQGGAASAAEMAQYLISFLSGGFWKGDVASVPQDFGCSTLIAEGSEGMLFGRNYDWEGANGQAMILHTVPKDGYESYSTCWLDFLGFGEGWKPEGMVNQYMSLAAIYVPLDGINEKGLCIADLMAGDNEQTNQRTEKTDLTTTSAIRLLLDRAATVDEAIALLDQYDMHSDIGRAHHIAIADASGKSVVVEYVNNEMIVTETDTLTNHYLCPGEKNGVGNEESHNRYEKLLSMQPGITEAAHMKDTMEAVSYTGITQWSIVYNMGNSSFDFYWQRKFDQPFHFELAHS